MSLNQITVKGAKEHNLKNINVRIPRDKLVVITGLSGSGKSSLAFDTIYAEGQRRYVESLSAYARQFLGQMEKPDVESIEGLSPAISIDQKTTSKNPRSTVGTVTEIYDYFRLLYARVGTPHCAICGIVIEQQTIDQIVDQVLKLDEGTKFQVLSPIIKGRKGEHKKELERLKKEGYVRVRVDGDIRDLAEDIDLEKNNKHTIEVVIDRLVMREGIEQRLSDSLETALVLSEGVVIINLIDGGDMSFNTRFACPEHGVGIDEMEPRMFSFNNPFGACESCKGIGHLLKVDEDLVISNGALSIDEGAIGPIANSGEGTYYQQLVESVVRHHKESMTKPFQDLPDKVRSEILYGTGDRMIEFVYESKFGGTRQYKATFEGIISNLERRYKETNSDYMRDKIEEYMSLTPCETCKGKRLKDASLAVKIGGVSITDLTDLSVGKIQNHLQALELDPQKTHIAEQILKEIFARLEFLKNVGLDYLTLSRAAGTLSGGESQRIRLATQIGSGLVGVLYILDEPSIGLHQKDNEKLLKTLRNLTDIGNTLLVVEHDEDTIRTADYIFDMGPGAGEHGGYVVAEGTFEDILNHPESVTGQYLSGRKKIDLPKKRLKHKDGFLKIIGARENNLKGISVSIPLGVWTCVTGVSGSGKSSLINEILFKATAQAINRMKVRPGKFDSIEGMELIDKVIDIDQSPIGRTPRSNPATYTGMFDHIRDLFASVPDAKMRGYQKGRFSFNVKGGRCEACKGDGILKIEMHFLPDVYVQCDVCKGKRYNRETLEVKYKGKNISEVLNLTVEEALVFFENIPTIHRKLKTLYEVGLGYIRLGQPSTQLSGGEAQRIKLSTELSKRSTGKTLYILDEPTTGLHVADVHKLIEVLHALVKGGNTVVVIEHNLDVIKCADYVIDLGPDGGDRGGEVVVAGTPEEVAAHPGSYTGSYLKPLLKRQTMK
jgi:excinuclease ABC subunit A